MQTKSEGLEEGMKIIPCTLKVTIRFSMPNSENSLCAPATASCSHPSMAGLSATPVASWNSFILGFTSVARL